MNSQDPMHWWQRPDLGYHNDRLQFAGRDVEQLAAMFGTPSFAYSAQRIQDKLRAIQGALDHAGFAGRHRILYAMKANRFAPLLTYLKQSGLCGIDACSPQEVEHAVSCGFAPADISFTATSLSAADFAMLARYDGLFMDCDSLHAINAWGQLKPGSEIGIRVNPGIGISRAGNDKLQYAGGFTSKFGIYREQFAEAMAVARKHRLTVSKIHFHTGCGYLTAQLPQLENVIGECLWFVEQAGDVRTVNIGGGLGVPHVAGEKPLDLAAWASLLARQFVSEDIRLEVEPGDYIVKDAGLLLLGQTYLERKRDLLFLGTDAGFNIAPEPAHYKLPFQPVPLRYQGEACHSVQVVGHINEALDVWAQDAQLPDMQGQPFLALINSGAYSASMASNHCMRGQLREFLLL